VLATAVLWIVSRGKWSDAIVDSGTEWIYADALARGQMLYRDALYWFGPFTPYFQAAFFRLFGSSFSTLVLCGLAGRSACYGRCSSLSAVTGRREAICGRPRDPALLFMPNSGGAILGMDTGWHPPASRCWDAPRVAARSAGRTPRCIGAESARAWPAHCTDGGVRSCRCSPLVLAHSRLSRTCS
jgi:hypothetical protein